MIDAHAIELGLAEHPFFGERLAAREFFGRGVERGLRRPHASLRGVERHQVGHDLDPRDRSFFFDRLPGFDVDLVDHPGDPRFDLDLPPRNDRSGRDRLFHDVGGQRRLGLVDHGFGLRLLIEKIERPSERSEDHCTD
jgi:hypothetical protein